mmetsp:Transcript_48769/g.74210  ORF Transcript_48769/g.74210 Transcript_48769/m.74210 type:complete len:206 (-) Transcript_48769:1874-2491(-)
MFSWHDIGFVKAQRQSSSHVNSTFGIQLTCVVCATNGVYPTIHVIIILRCILKFMLFYLTRAEHNSVYFQYLSFAILGIVQVSIFVNLIIFDTIDHVDITSLQRGSVDPSRGATKCRSHLSLLSLHQVDLAFRWFVMNFLQTASRGLFRIDSPLFPKLFDRYILMRLVLFMIQQELCYIKSDSSGSDNSYSISNCLVMFQNINIT